jgi:cyclohexyl-isocyanide hydratase
MEYEPDPPFHSGRPESAPPEVLAAFEAQYAALAKIAGLVKG